MMNFSYPYSTIPNIWDFDFFFSSRVLVQDFNEKLDKICRYDMRERERGATTVMVHVVSFSFFSS
jgi:ABC-type uncharacterized transport system substrate-binding protein